MAYSQSMLLLLIAGMLFTGTINTILNKLQDLTCVENCDGDPSERHHFEQPIWQTLNMFIGEALCLIVFYIGSMVESKRLETEPDQASEDPQDQQPPLDEPLGIEMTGKANLLLWIPTMCKSFAKFTVIRRLDRYNTDECWSNIHFSIHISNAKRISSLIHWSFIFIIS